MKSESAKQNQNKNCTIKIRAELTKEKMRMGKKMG
jgi:hypothetical protein